MTNRRLISLGLLSAALLVGCKEEVCGVGGDFTSPPCDRGDEDDEDTPLHLRGPSGLTVVSDPVSRVTDLLIRGRQALLTDDAEAIVRPSLTRAARTEPDS